MKTSYSSKSVYLVLSITKLILFCLLFLATSLIAAAPASELWPKWKVSNNRSVTVVDHSVWNGLLGRYVVEAKDSGPNIVRYAQFSQADKQALNSYIRSLEAIKVSNLNQKEQLAYWLNLYNAVTIHIVLKHYPVKSIRDIRLGGIFSSGPWDEKLLSIEAEKISLNDIEHRILRPIFTDPRIHYGVNCASFGCPNLQNTAFTAANTEQLLSKAASEFINSPRGLRMEAGVLVLSSIYSWFAKDFGSNWQELRKHLQRWGNTEVQKVLSKEPISIRYEYNWALNE